jgi:hypothetical protein
MKIPVLDGPREQERAAPTPYSNLNQDTGSAAVANGLSELGAGIAHVSKAIEHAREKANAVAVNDMLTTYQAANISALDGSEDQPGFLSTRGKEAAAVRGDTLGNLEKLGGKMEESLGDDEQRAMFRKHAAQIFLGTRARVESHVQRQNEEAVTASLAGRVATSLTSIANNYQDTDGVASQEQAAVEQTIRAFAGPMGDADAKVAAYKQKVAETRLNQYLGNKDWKGAQALYSQVKGDLGTGAPQFAATIATERQKQEGDRTAVSVISDARKENGFVDEAKAISAFQALPEEQRTEEATRSFSKWLNVEQEKRKATEASYFSSAMRNYNLDHNLGDVRSEDEVWMRNNDPEAWRRLEQMAKADARPGAKNAEATPAQASAMTRFLVDANDHPDKYATMPVDQFERTWAPQLSVKDRAKAGAQLATLHGKASKPDEFNGAESRLFVQMGRDAGLFPQKQNDTSKWDDAAAQAYYRGAQKLTDLSAEYRKQNGKAPPIEQVQQWASELLMKGKDPARGFLGFGGGTTRLEAEVKGTGFTPTWDDAQKKAAVDALRSAGARVDDASVEGYLRRKHKLPSLPTKATPPPAPAAAASEVPATPTVTNKALSGEGDVPTSSGGY